MLLCYRWKICSVLLSLFCIFQWSLSSKQFIFNRLLQQIKYVELVALPRKIPNGQFAFCLRAPLTLPKKRSRKPCLAAAVRASRDLSAPLATLTLTRGTMALLSALLAVHPPLCPPCQQSDQPRRTSVNDKSSRDTRSISCKLRFTVLQMMSVRSNFEGQ